MFEKGKWYKVKFLNSDYIIQVSKLENNFLNFSMSISEGYIVHKYIPDSWGSPLSDFTYISELTNLNEIQEYLPEGHPDKITQDEYKVGDWVIVSLGSVEYVAKLTRVSPPKGRFKVLNTSDSLQKGEGSFDKIVRKAKLEEIPLTDLSNDEILEIAKQYYPIGTKFKSAVSGQIFTVKDGHNCSGTIFVNTIEINKDGNYNGCVFDLKQKKWAEIVSTSQEVKDDFVLPERWCIEITNENRNLLQTFYEQNIGKYKGCSKDWMIGKNGGFFVYPGDRHFHTCAESSAQQRWKNKITTEQFKKYVLGEKVETNYIFPTELLEKRLEQLETSNEIYIPTITKEKKKIDYTINSVFADIKVNLPEKPKKIVKSIVLEKFNLII